MLPHIPSALLSLGRTEEFARIQDVLNAEDLFEDIERFEFDCIFHPHSDSEPLPVGTCVRTCATLYGARRSCVNFLRGVTNAGPAALFS